MKPKVGIFLSHNHMCIIVHEDGKHKQFRTGLKFEKITNEQKRAFYKFVLRIFYGMKNYDYESFKSLIRSNLNEHILNSFLK